MSDTFSNMQHVSSGNYEEFDEKQYQPGNYIEGTDESNEQQYQEYESMLFKEGGGDTWNAFDAQKTQGQQQPVFSGWLITGPPPGFNVTYPYEYNLNYNSGVSSARSTAVPPGFSVPAAGSGVVSSAVPQGQFWSSRSKNEQNVDEPVSVVNNVDPVYSQGQSKQVSQNVLPIGSGGYVSTDTSGANADLGQHYYPRGYPFSRRPMAYGMGHLYHHYTQHFHSMEPYGYPVSDLQDQDQKNDGNDIGNSVDQSELASSTTSFLNDQNDVVSQVEENLNDLRIEENEELSNNGSAISSGNANVATNEPVQKSLNEAVEKTPSSDSQTVTVSAPKSTTTAKTKNMKKENGTQAKADHNAASTDSKDVVTKSDAEPKVEQQGPKKKPKQGQQGSQAKSTAAASKAAPAAKMSWAEVLKTTPTETASTVTWTTTNSSGASPTANAGSGSSASTTVTATAKQQPQNKGAPPGQQQHQQQQQPKTVSTTAKNLRAEQSDQDQQGAWTKPVEDTRAKTSAPPKGTNAATTAAAAVKPAGNSSGDESGQVVSSSAPKRTGTVQVTMPTALSPGVNMEKLDEITRKMLSTCSINPSGPSFNASPEFAKFFVIKSYSEDDVHKSIKYGIWTSTDSGNKRLDKGYREFYTKGPIYLFFSVNASGQFCGIAQMMSPLDFSKKASVWNQEDKWNGQFEVKWMFIKDIPNNVFRHIRLTNNENKPVTNSRDTQEVFLEPGREILKIFKAYKCKTSILDDFPYYNQQEEQDRVAREAAKRGSPGNSSAGSAQTQHGGNSSSDATGTTASTPSSASSPASTASLPSSSAPTSATVPSNGPASSASSPPGSASVSASGSASVSAPKPSSSALPPVKNGPTKGNGANMKGANAHKS